MEWTVSEDRLRAVLKQAVIEVLEERADFLRELFVEILEDIALERAIEEGQATDLVPAEQIHAVLEQRP